MTASSYDVVVVGGGPGGSSTATFLANGGLRVALFEREVFPRFHVGESLMPAVMLLLEQLGAREAVERAGFQIKYGAMFVDEEAELSQTFYFLPGQAWPNYSYQVPRADFDTMLLDHARTRGVTVYQPATVETAEMDAAGVTVAATTADAPVVVRARMLVDASGRDGFLASRIGRRVRIPNLGKVAFFSHFRGADRLTGKEEGNIRIYVFDAGWFWWIPLAGDLTSIGAVVHARTVQAWSGSPEELYADMIRRCQSVAGGLASAERVTPVHRVANFSYANSPVIGERFVAVGDAITFVDPIFSGGVYIAMRSGQLAAEAILQAFKDGRFHASRFTAYERRVRRGVAPLFRFIHKYYEPAFFDLFMHPRNYLGVYTAVLNVLSGGSFIRFTWRTRLSLAIFFGLARVHTWLRRRAGLPIESRLEW
ncbi:MAG TPA: NAD(P)/FAD-dependent oxidoreductase [Methylomirabilota bacterium]|jgi:flavin-dependent dehydrogenase|nr:NAD(P)/FAD-dependent oxidoreductase [Methylomirabilota bacterium]